MTSLLNIKHLIKRFDERVLFDIPELTLQQGSVYVLTGPNGSGKTTLLRVLTGLEPATIASASFLEQAVQLSPYPKQLREAIVYVHQQPVLFSTSIADNIAYGLRARGMDSKHIAQEVANAMTWANVTHLRDHDPATLSGGEKQRVALARAKVLKPRLLLLDEPTAHLDEASREQVSALIPAFIQDGGSLLIVSHDPQLISLPHVNWTTLEDGKLKYL